MGDGTPADDVLHRAAGLGLRYVAVEIAVGDGARVLIGDAACPAAALAAGIQAPDGGLAVFVPQQPHRGGAAAFHGGEHCVRLVIALQLPSQNG